MTTVEATAASTKISPRLKTRYSSEIKQALNEQFNYANVMQIPGIVTQEAAIHVSNVMVVDSDGNPTRIGYRVDEESGKKVRVSKRNGKDI